MSGSVVVVGIHPVEGWNDVHLIECEVKAGTTLDFAEVTQQADDLPRSDWQVAYDERAIATENGRRFAFLFHHLDFSKPLVTNLGAVDLPQPTPVPAHLRHIGYEPP